MKRRAFVPWLAVTALAAGGVRAEPQAQRRPWPRATPTPALDLAGLDGRPWDLAAQRGQVVALNFWASWCEPCREEMPSLQLMAQRHEGDGLLVVAVNYREGGGTIRRFVERTALDLPVLRDADGLAARALGVRVFPSTVFVRRDGRIDHTVVGAADWTGASARDWVRALL
ncbi:MAG: TlpA family protein disulfide reductase [Piscinibacter sp.]|nr:TlpA family protein disulfide reductase [Piscinibacter sp.]